MSLQRTRKSWRSLRGIQIKGSSSSQRSSLTRLGGR
jgi:hypothetical protein